MSFLKPTFARGVLATRFQVGTRIAKKAKLVSIKRPFSLHRTGKSDENKAKRSTDPACGCIDPCNGCIVCLKCFHRSGPVPLLVPIASLGGRSRADSNTPCAAVPSSCSFAPTSSLPALPAYLPSSSSIPFSSGGSHACVRRPCETLSGLIVHGLRKEWHRERSRNPIRSRQIGNADRRTSNVRR